MGTTAKIWLFAAIAMIIVLLVAILVKMNRPARIDVAGTIESMADTIDSIEGQTLELKRRRARIEVVTLDTAVLMWSLDHNGQLPHALIELVNGPDPRRYVDYLNLDPWGRIYVYRHPSRSGKKPSAKGPDFEIFCTGPDGREGTADDITKETKVKPLAHEPTIEELERR